MRAEGDQEDTGASWLIPRTGTEARATPVTEEMSGKSY